MVRHAELVYPAEAAGFLVGSGSTASQGAAWRVARSVPAENVDRGIPRRFRIRGEEIRRLEADLTGASQAILGFYHSHPDAPAEPSQQDANLAWPGYGHLVLEVRHSRVRAWKAFEYEPETGCFCRLPVRVMPVGGPRDAVSGGPESPAIPSRISSLR